MTDKTIYDLELHDKIQLPGTYTWILRVPGGWIYIFGNEESDSSVFVPYISQEEDAEQ